MQRRLVIAAAVAAALAGRFAYADSYPSKPIRLVVPFPAGSSTDVVARTIGAVLYERLRQPVIVENKPGAGGGLAGRAVADAEPDGYTLFMGTVANAVGMSYYEKPGYELVNGLTPVTLVTTAPLVVVVGPTAGVDNLGDLVRLARRSSRPLTFGSGGNGTANHLVGEMINQKANIKLQHVPYKGAVLALNDLMGGQIDVVIGSLIDSMPLIRAGKIKAVAVTGATRVPMLPDVPTAAEHLPGLDALGWHGLFAPRGTPRDVVERLSRETVEVLRAPDVRAKLEAAGALPAGLPGPEFGTFVRAEVAKWAAAVKVAGARGD